MDNDDYITTIEAAEILGGITIQAVINAINRGRIKGKKFGRSHMVSKQSVLEYKASRGPAARGPRDEGE